MRKNNRNQMKKKYPVIIAILAMAVLCMGCKTTTEENSKENDKKEVVLDDAEKKNSKDEKASLCIDFAADGMHVGDKVFPLPVDGEELIALWGEPRVVVHEDPEYPDAPKRTNYVWDEKGIFCYLYKQGDVYSDVNCIGVVVNKDNDYVHYPQKMFKGTMTIEGKPWYEALPDGEDLEIFRVYTVGDYSLWSEYTDIYEPEKTGTAADYVGIEMSIASE